MLIEPDSVFSSYKRGAAASEDNGVEIEKSNILLVGPTGSGKTKVSNTE